jgi:hypothetical protein
MVRFDDVLENRGFFTGGRISDREKNLVKIPF